MGKYIIGVDNGSQSTKVSIFDLKGGEVAFGSWKLKNNLTPEPGIVVHPDDDLWDSIKMAIKKCLENFNGDKNDIVGMGICTIRCCRVLLKEDGSLAYPIISWMDTRMKDPYKHEDDNVKFVTSTTGYISNRLTGEFTDCGSNCEFGWPLDLEKLQWSEDDEVIKSCGLKREMLFDVVKPGELLGRLKPELAREWGLPDKLPVVASSNDKAVEVLGSGVNTENRVMISLGTFISAMLYRENIYVGNPKSFWTTLACVPHKYVYESHGIRRGMWTVSWLKNILGEEITIEAKKLGLSEEDYLNLKASHIPAGSDGLITILDWLATYTEPYRKGIMIGFDQRHTKFHMYRSILEAIAFGIKNNVCDMIDEVGVKLDEVVVIGGGSKSDLLMQIIADQFNLKVLRQEGSSCGALGSAMCVAKYAGIYKTFDETIENMVRTEKIFIPNKETHKLYDRINNEVIKNVRIHTDEVLKCSHPIFK
ncbi:FGGY-family carbohydrate kinase [Paraclostridium ghonii]|uniref:Sugar (Pentulose or hexulose) kinase n=1 Tax=Paraclostridium ghonii TaxID=29358 RepID=A0ABU0MXZ4_9FIRM|nr:FGGY family carbohydrate kinase [Paeniclostridium ghonii]MDQ0555780.1 sugar (pentulose or hexulose) kinase [Paeniclostridium ghonii]